MSLSSSTDVIYTPVSNHTSRAQSHLLLTGAIYLLSCHHLCTVFDSLRFVSTSLFNFPLYSNAFSVGVEMNDGASPSLDSKLDDRPLYLWEPYGLFTAHELN